MPLYSAVLPQSLLDCTVETCGDWEEGKIKALGPRAPVFSLQHSRSCIFLSLVFTDGCFCRGERNYAMLMEPNKAETANTQAHC